MDKGMDQTVHAESNGVGKMTDREFAQKVLERQELLIGSMNRMLDTMEIHRDIILETRKTLFDLVEWLHQPPSEDFDTALGKMTEALNALAVRAVEPEFDASQWDASDLDAGSGD